MGLVHIYCGDGKGKTTSAVGCAVRFAGSGGKVLFCQFMKSGRSSELGVLAKIPNITVQNGFTLRMCPFYLTDAEKEKAAQEYPKQFDEMIQLTENGDYGMLVMDEIMSCISCGFLPLDKLVEFLKKRSESLEVVMTGRDPDEAVLECADYVSEIRKCKHPFDKGISARKGIEF